ncbi:hypothetical protein IW137_000634 [Coemansia sp. RSA 1287]|nr:hypothetical protein IW137_000634 [Coemansia sp. RSA 1287]KAJ2730278.1 hypothetical protein H4S00_000075 [Coemansia sp. D1744]
MVIEAKLASHTQTLPNLVLGQLAEYSRVVWKEQPTRTFVPVILLHGANMSLFVFARSGYYRANLGAYLFASAAGLQEDTSDFRLSLRNLWFLMKQPPNRFGHFADVSIDYEFLRFSGSVLDSKVEVVGLGNVSDVEVGDRITRHIPLIRRAAFLTKAKYRGMPAVLKYSWTPVDRLPEGAVYKVLESQNVSCLPNIYSSGILVKDVFGYRLEYLLMEDCGETIESRFSKISGPWVLPNLIKSACADISDAITKTTECLVEAASAGVLHRDISTGNITICKGQIRVIDWGYAKLLHTNTPEIQNIANEWGFDLGDVTKNENIHDGMTGTPLFMGIRVLFGHPTRSLLDDIESLFYVAMYALSHLSRGPSASPAFNVHENKTAAYVKLGSVTSRVSYLECFGVKMCSDDVKAQLDLLYQLLFCRDNQFIGEKLMDDEVDVRVVDTTIMRKIIGSDLADQIYGSQVDNDMPVENAPPKRKTRAAKTKKPAPKKPKPADTNNNQDYTVPQLRPRPGRDTK